MATKTRKIDVFITSYNDVFITSCNDYLLTDGTVGHTEIILTAKLGTRLGLAAKNAVLIIEEEVPETLKEFMESKGLTKSELLDWIIDNYK